MGMHEVHSTIPVISVPKGTIAARNKVMREHIGCGHATGILPVSEAGAWIEVQAIARAAYESSHGATYPSKDFFYVVEEDGRQACGTVALTHLGIYFEG